MNASLMQQAMAAHQAGNLDEAERLYRAVLQATPRQPDAQALLGTIYSARGDHTQAITLIKSALTQDPEAGLFHFYLGTALMAAGRVPEAAESLFRATQRAPRMPEASYNLGNALRLLGRVDQAIPAYELTLHIAPGHVEARNNLGILLGDKGQTKDAMRHLQQVVAEAPGFIDGWINLCNFAEKAGAYDVAYQAGLQAIARAPQSSLAWLGLGVALNRLDRHAEAAAAYQSALLLEPGRADLWDNLAQTYQFMNNLPEADKAYRQTILCDGQALDDETILTCDEKEIGSRHWHLALLELLAGDLRHGFARYRARFGEVGGLTRPAWPQPVWRGQDLAGKTILVLDEQGMGDCLMMARFLPLLKAKGARVLFCIAPALIPLFQGWSGADVILPRGSDVPPFDYFASIFDLPFGLGVTLESLPTAPYLPTPAPNEATRLAPSDKPRVGVVWAGAPLHKHDSRRSVPLSIFAALFDAKDVSFFVLNKDKRDGDDLILSALPHVQDLTPQLNNFAITAQFMQQMDLIITCDTATAHLAGGMGKKVWTLLPFAPDWRWLLDRDDSPWYPSMRLFRQTTNGDWADVMRRVQAAVKQG